MKKSKLLFGLVLKEFTREKQKYIVIILFFLIGITAGSVTSSLNDKITDIQNYVETFLSAYSIQGTIKSQVYFISLLNYLKFSFFLWLSGWHLWLIPLCFLQVFLKGFRIGYTISCFVQCYQFKGIILSLLTMFPQNFIFLPALFFFSVYQLQFASERRLLFNRKNTLKSQKNIYVKNLVYLLLFFIILLFCALMEGYVIPELLHPICKFIK